MQTDADVIIIGAGAAGLTAAQYAARSNLSTLVIEELAPGGQAVVIDALENYPGIPDPVSGMEFTERMERQAKKFGARFAFDTVTALVKEAGFFRLSLSKNTLSAQAVIVASGARHRLLDVPGEKELTGRGVSYCATCDGPFFKNKRMLVVGGGDAACDEATYLSHLAEKVILIHRRDRFRAQPSLAGRVLENPKIEVRFRTECLRVSGDNRVQSVQLQDNAGNRKYEEAVDAVFVFVGSIPRTGFLTGVTLDEAGYIVTNGRMESNIRGLFAAGDVRATPFRQLVVAAGEGAIAAHEASAYLDELRGQAYR
jgi:thioredoxin reductase (NADPH)